MIPRGTNYFIRYAVLLLSFKFLFPNDYISGNGVTGSTGIYRPTDTPHIAQPNIHLEVASDLSSETFLMAICRFIARRGPVEQMHSDCGTNFIGAAKLFQPVDNFIHSTEFHTKCEAYLTAQNISWHFAFQPPSAPHFGGFYEAGVKSVKTSLYRNLGLRRLTYEELNTLLSRIEATLNSCPLGALSSDPSDFEALTPSNFLTLMSSTTNIEPNLEKIP